MFIHMKAIQQSYAGSHVAWLIEKLQHHNDNYYYLSDVKLSIHI